MISRPQRAAADRFRSFCIESLESRRLLTAVLVQPISNVAFAQDSGPETVDFYALFADSSGAVDLKFTATSSDTSVVTTSILGNNLTLNPTAGRSGFSIVKMVATDPNGVRVVNSFRVQITALDARALDVTLDAKHRSVTFVQTDHASATISLSGPGTAVVHFGGDGLKLVGSTVQGAHAEMEKVTLTNTSAKTHLMITGARSGSGFATIGNVIASSTLGSLDIHKALLIGDIQASNALNELDVDLAETGLINIGGGATRLTVGSASDEVFSSAGSVSSFKVTQWLDSDNVPESFVANGIRNMDVRGTFVPSLDVVGTGIKGKAFDNIKVRGSVGGAWFIEGATGSVEIQTFLDGWQGNFTSISSFIADGNFASLVKAQAISRFKVRGTLFGTLVLTGNGKSDLASLQAATISGGQIFATSSIGSITAGALSNATIFVAVGNIPTGDVLPTAASDFSANASIGAIRLRAGRTGGFLNSKIAAPRLGTLALGNTATKNGGKAYGIAAESIDNLSMADRSRDQTISLRKIKTAAALQTAITSHKWLLGDLLLRLV